MGDTMPQSICRSSESGFIFIYDASSQRACLNLRDAVAFVARMEPEAVHTSQILKKLLPWQRKLVHNARVWRHLTRVDIQKVRKTMKNLDDDGNYVFPFPGTSFGDDLDDDDLDDDDKRYAGCKFNNGVWHRMSVVKVDFMTPFKTIHVNEDRFKHYDVVENHAGSEMDLMFWTAKVSEIRGRAFNDQDIYWPLPAYVTLVQQVLTEAVHAYVNNHESDDKSDDDYKYFQDRLGKVSMLYFRKVDHLITMDQFEIFFLNQCQRVNQARVSLSTAILSTVSTPFPTTPYHESLNYQNEK
jgi:hypothetical protein